MQPQLTKPSVLKALREFDDAFRESDEWTDWEANQAHKYALRHGGRLYPVKKIASLASGVPVSEFSGGGYPGHANGLLSELNFEIVTLTRGNPDWVRDELILVLDFYLAHRTKIPDKRSEEIHRLSQVLNQLGLRLFPPSERRDTFRNVNGTYMKLMNFRRLDPIFTASGKKGLSAGAKADEEVWREFGQDGNRCHEVAVAIIASLEEPDDPAPGSNEWLDEGEDEAPEGRLLARKHTYRERNRKLVHRKKQRVLRDRGKLECEVCAFNFVLAYGAHGDGFIECHHTKPVATLRANDKTHLKDLALLCANCHRMIHRGKKWLQINELRELIARSIPIS